MSPVRPVPFECLTALSLVVDQQLCDRDQDLRAAVFSLCIEAIAFGREDAPGVAATRAGSAAHLLLDLTFPELGEPALTQLSRACERAAVGA
jgi:hypothetical protein